MTAHLSHGDDFTALTVRDISGATLNMERTDAGVLSAWIAPPGGNDGHSVLLAESDVIALVAYVSAGASQPLSDAPSVTVELPDDEHIEVHVNGQVVASANHDEHGWSGMDAVERTALAVARAFDPAVNA